MPWSTMLFNYMYVKTYLNVTRVIYTRILSAIYNWLWICLYNIIIG